MGVLSFHALTFSPLFRYFSDSFLSRSAKEVFASREIALGIVGMTAKAVLHQVLTDQCRASVDKLSDATRVVRKHGSHVPGKAWNRVVRKTVIDKCGEHLERGQFHSRPSREIIGEFFDER